MCNQIGADRFLLPHVAMKNIFHLSLAAALMILVAFSANQLWGQTTSPGTIGPTMAPEAGASSAQDADPGNIDKLLEMADKDVSQLAQVKVASQTGSASLDLPVSSVARQESTVGRSAAAVFVITNEMIRRSGATCIPEALRMAPGLEVARVNSNTWAITARGFNNAFANKLLVLIDGRTVYSPAFNGVYWDAQDVLLDDVERIEVVRGPGGTLWGANAVNGVISIITKNSKDTKGAFVTAGGGTYERSNEAFRYGGQIGENCTYRVYGKYFDRGPFCDPSGPTNDAWNQGQTGFRADWNLDKFKTDTLTVQGDHYVGNSGMSAGWTQDTPPYQQTLFGKAYNTGDNILARWKHVITDDSDWTLQTYFDNFQRDTFLNSNRTKTWDIDFQYRFQLTERQQITCGTGYRLIHDQLPSNNPFCLGVIPEERNTYIASQFIQDEITLAPDLLQLILGCKLEQNSYTYFEYQPTIRVLYTPDKKNSFWGAVSRAVHTPSRVDEDLFATTSVVDPIYGQMFLRSTGNPNMVSETLMAYELGWREQMTERLSWDIATFYNSYDKLRILPFTGFTPPNMLLFQFGNGASAESYGVELATNYSLSERWTLTANYTYLQMHVFNDQLLYGDGNSPCNQIYIRSSWNVRKDVDFDLMGRYVDRLLGLNVPNYIEMDMRIAWRPRKRLELALVGQNLLDSRHYEFGSTTELSSAIISETPRSVYGTVSWRY
jgi:iron complex outermembrane recepter protein